MTRNLYLGADLAPLFEATAGDLATVARATYDQVLASDVEQRIDAVAGEIADARPDVVALQEASVWSETAPGAATATVRYDFAVILLDALRARDEPYTVVASADGFSGGLPVEGVGTVTLQDRDVIIVRDGGAVRATQPSSGTFDHDLTLNVAGASIDVVRGWASVRATVASHDFRIVATHLEAFDAGVRDAQLQELLDVVDASDTPTIVLGDLNSATSGPDTSSAYDAAVAGGLVDAWPAGTEGNTCCRAADARGGDLYERIDYVLVHGDFHVVTAEVVGTDARSRTPTGRWSSDHAGVLSILQLPEAS